MREKEFVVYDVYYCDFLAYVGSGTVERPQHVKSGRSHSQSLNELFVRSEVYGEPNVQVDVYKYFDTKEKALECEKKRIRSTKPLFNRTYQGRGRFRILTTKEKGIISSIDQDLLDRVDRLEYIGDVLGINPKLAFTPYGFRCSTDGIKWNHDCYDVVSISTFGKCTFLDGYCEYYIDHNDNIVIKVLSTMLEMLNNCLGFEKFKNYFDSKQQRKKPFIFRDDYDPNYNGSGIHENCYKYMTDDIVLARKVNTYKGIEVVICLRSIDEYFEVFCLNNDQIIYATQDSSLALEANRNTELTYYKFITRINDSLVETEFTLKGCIDFNQLDSQVEYLTNIRISVEERKCHILEWERGYFDKLKKAMPLVTNLEHNDIRVELTPEIEEFVSGFDFNIVGGGKWLNLSCTTKPYRSFMAMYRYTRYSQEDFLALDLNYFKKC